MQRRTGPRPIPPTSVSKFNGGGLGSKALSPAVKAETATQPEDGKKIQRRTSSQGESKPKDQTRQQSAQEKKGASKTPGLKREQSDIFKSFSKPQAKVSRTNTESSVEASSTPKTVRCVKVVFHRCVSDFLQAGPCCFCPEAQGPGRW